MKVTVETLTDALRNGPAWDKARHEASSATGHRIGCHCIECGLIREESVYAQADAITARAERK